jgi:large subunit ribosomal protein L21
MYAVIRTGGKQYRVQPGDLIVVEKLDGEPGANVAFEEVLMLGEGAEVTLGAPLIVGASVSATLVETRKGEKIKVFKKIRRQGYRRTQGHRQFESVLRVVGISGDGREAGWDGVVDLTPVAEIRARARNVARGMDAARTRAAERAARKTPTVAAAPEAEAETSTAAKPKAKAVRAKSAAPKATAAAGEPAAKAETPAKAPRTRKTAPKANEE